jgi:energy-coupling factor transporter ATP-binding protein EcfA2
MVPRSLSKLVVAAVATVGLAAAASAQAPRELRIFNWSNYIDEQVLRDFEREFNAKVTYDTYDSNEVLETRLLAGRTGYDIVVPSAPFLSRQIAANVHQRLDPAKIPNRTHFWPEIQRRTAAYDPGNAYSVNYLWGTTDARHLREGVLLAARPLGLRQDHADAHAGRLREPTEGRILLQGKDISGVPPYKRPVNMMFQSYALFPHMTVEKNIAFGLEQDGPAQERDRRPRQEMLRSSSSSSSPSASRPALGRPAPARGARPLARQAPEGAAARRAARRARQEAARGDPVRAHGHPAELGLTFLIVTHDQEEAMTVADRIAVMDKGVLVQVATPPKSTRRRIRAMSPTSSATSTSSRRKCQRQGRQPVHARFGGACGQGRAAGMPRRRRQCRRLRHPAGKGADRTRRAGSGRLPMPRRAKSSISAISAISPSSSSGSRTAASCGRHRPMSRVSSTGPSPSAIAVWLTWPAESGIVLTR